MGSPRVANKNDAALAKIENEETAVKRHYKSWESRYGLMSTIDLATSIEGVTVPQDRYDVDPWLLNCENGTIDLRSGQLLAHSRDDLITKIAGTHYDPQAKCPAWDNFLREVQPDEETRRFLQRAAGYSLTGSTKEQCLFLNYGTGRNGKSTFFNQVSGALSEYARGAEASTFLSKSADSINNDLAALAGARFITIAETGNGRKMAETLVKQFTGGDTISARFLRCEYFQFVPVGKLWMMTNHKPIIYGTDVAIWRRILLIPWSVTIAVGNEDKDLPSKLAIERPGILRWLIDGCLAWQNQGLAPPKQVLAATEAYRDEMDTLAPFFEECCEVEPDRKVPWKDLWFVYNWWVKQRDIPPLREQTFRGQLQSRGFSPYKSGSVRGWEGLEVHNGKLKEALEAAKRIKPSHDAPPILPFR